MLVIHGLPLLELGREDGHGHCPSEPEKWGSEFMVIFIPLPEGKKEGRKEARREGNGKCESRRRSVGKDNE